MNESGLKYFNLCKDRIPSFTSEEVSQMGLEKDLVCMGVIFIIVCVSFYKLKLLSIINSGYILTLKNT